jgi:hypothetical protein
MLGDPNKYTEWASTLPVWIRLACLIAVWLGLFRLILFINRKPKMRRKLSLIRAIEMNTFMPVIYVVEELDGGPKHRIATFSLEEVVDKHLTAEQLFDLATGMQKMKTVTVPGDVVEAIRAHQ